MIDTPLRRTTTRGAAALGAAAVLLLGACGGVPAGDAGGATASAPAASTPSDGAPSEGASPDGGGAAAGPPDVDGQPPVEIDLSVAGGEVRGAPGRVEVPLGGTVRLTVAADEADEVHVHGYDRTLALTPGTPASVEFVADIPGVFEVELHESGLALTSLQVQ